MKLNALLCLASLLAISTPYIQGSDPAARDHAARDHAATAEPFEIPIGTHDLPDLVLRAAEFLHRNILWSPTQDKRGANALTVEITEPLKLGPHACEDVISGMLFRCGYALVPVNVENSIYEVINMQGSRRAEIHTRAIYQTPAEVRARPNLYMMTMSTVRLKHVSATVATTTLRPFFATTGGSSGLMVGNMGNDNALLLQGFAPQVAGALHMIESVDQPAPEPTEEEQATALEIQSLRARIEKLELMMTHAKRR